MQEWQPTTTIAAIKARAKLLQQIREFFAAREVLEVETPCLAKYGVTDVNIDMIPAVLNSSEEYFLQTSPEYAMKRLLAQHKTSIFQITKSFRDGEQGRYHNPEFTMLEWYRVGFDHFALMAEVEELLSCCLNTGAAKKVTYGQLFKDFLQLDPFVATIDQLKQCWAANGVGLFSENSTNEMSKDDWLDLLFSSCIEPKLQGDYPWMVYDYPVAQAALAKVNPYNPEVAQRFEVYVNGIELANGYNELTCEQQHRQRFLVDNQKRVLKGKPKRELDEYLLAALQAGLPKCAGIALGVDRLLMLQLGVSQISEVISFPVLY